MESMYSSNRPGWAALLDEKVTAYLPDLKYVHDEPLARHTSFRIGGPATRMAFPTSGEQIVLLTGFAQECGVTPFLLGNGTNLLVADEGLDTLVIQTGEGLNRIALDGGIITADAPFDPISAYGDNSAAVAARLGVDPGMTWAEAARQLNVPLYSVTAMLEVPEALCGSEAFADPLFNEDGSLSYFSLQPLNGTADAAQLVCQVWLRVERENLDDPEHPMNEWKAYEPLSIAVQPTLDAREYAVPAEAQTQGNFTLESVQAQLTPSGVHLIAVFAAQAGATEEKAYERLREVRFVQPDGSEYPTGMNLSGGISNLDQWPQVEVKQMIGTEKIPERIGMSFAGGQQPIQLTLKK